VDLRQDVIPFYLVVVATAYYMTLFVICIAVPLYSRFRLQSTMKDLDSTYTHSSTKIVTVFIGLFCIVRVIWFWINELLGDVNIWQFLLNRIALILFFTGFCLVLFTWIESLSYNSNVYENAQFLPNTKKKFIAVIVIVYIITGGITLGFLLTFDRNYNDRTHMDSNFYYGLSIYFLAFVNLLVVLAFFIYGICLGSKLKQYKTSKDSRVVQVQLVSLGFILCFLLRTVLVMHHTFTGTFLSADIYYVFSYLVPEGTAIMIQLVVQFRQASYHAEQLKLRPWERNSLMID